MDWGLGGFHERVDVVGRTGAAIAVIDQEKSGGFRQANFHMEAVALAKNIFSDPDPLDGVGRRVVGDGAVAGEAEIVLENERRRPAWRQGSSQ